MQKETSQCASTQGEVSFFGNKSCPKKERVKNG